MEAAPVVEEPAPSLSINAVLAGIDDLRESADREEAIFQGSRWLAELFRQDPFEVWRALPLVSGRYGKEAAEAVIEGLAIADTEASQLALVRLMLDPSSDVRQSAMRAMTRTENPSPALIVGLQDYLRANDRTSGTEAIEALGHVAAMATRQGRGNEAEGVARLLAERLPSCQDSPTRIHLLRALCQARWPEAVRLLLDETSDRSAEVRAAAATALGRVKGSEVDERLEALAEKDAEESVREAAAEALAMRPGHTDGCGHEAHH